MPTFIPFRGSRGLAAGAVAAAALAMLLTACSGPPAGGETPGGDAPGTIGFVTFDSTSVAAASEADAAIGALKDADWEVLSQDAKGDAAQGNAICTQYVTRQVTALVISVFQLNQMAQCMDAANSAQIPVFFLDSSLEDGMAGAIQTASPGPVNDLLVENVKGLDNLQVLQLQYSPATPSLLRSTYMREQLAKAGVPDDAFTEHEVQIPGQVTDAQSATQAWLALHPESSDENLVIWTSWSDAAVGALAALNQAGRTVPIYTWDLTKQAVEPLKDGTFVATSLSDPDGLAEQLVKMIDDHLAGGKPEGLDAPAIVLDSSNIDDYLAQHPDAAQ